MKKILAILIIIGLGLLDPVSGTEPTRTIEFQYEHTDGEVVFSRVRNLLEDKSIGSSARMLLKLPNGDLRLLHAISSSQDDPTFISVSIRDPNILTKSEGSSEPLLIFSTHVKLIDGKPFTLIETSEGIYSLTITWGDVADGPNKAE